VDGKFDYCVKLFYQLFTFHGCSNGHYYNPLVFRLLKKKRNKRLILIILDQFVKKCLELNVVLSPTEIVIDYELPKIYGRMLV